METVPIVKRLSLVLFASIFILTGCATSISPQLISNADYGQPPTDGHQQVIRQRFDQILIDPTSPLYEFDKPRKGYTKASPMFGTSEAFGWRVCGTINSKNRFGGYTGRSPFFILFRGDEIMTFMSGESGTNSSLRNLAIQEACSR